MLLPRSLQPPARRRRVTAVGGLEVCRGYINDRPIRRERFGRVVQHVPDVLSGSLDISAVQRMSVGHVPALQVLIGAVRQRGGPREKARVPVARAHTSDRVAAQSHERTE